MIPMYSTLQHTYTTKAKVAHLYVAMAYLLAVKYAINYKMADRQSAVERKAEMVATRL